MKGLLRGVLVSLVVITLFACSKANERASNIDPRTGKHPSGWVLADTGGNHPVDYLADSSSCQQCHGADLNGGISRVSCFSVSRGAFTCHAGGPSGHPAGWSAADLHGAAAKAKAQGVSGLTHCQLCHGVDFSGGLANRSCLNTGGCHGLSVPAPHAASPWRDVGRNGARTHTSADPSNAAACAVCHTAGANSTRQPSPAAPAGSAPGCFNNTLCHGVEGHATGWSSPSSHGRGAKAAPGGILVNGILSPLSSFASCTPCHGTDFDGGSSQRSCLNSDGCHGPGVAAPHPATPWRSTDGSATHTSTDSGNAGICALCHSAGANSSRSPQAGELVGSTGCFNNTLCHGVEGHPAGWNTASQHGAAAKGAVGPATGFSSCQPCHGTTFNNGSQRSCTNSAGCHGLLVSSPHPAKPWLSTTPGGSTHTSTDPGNAAVCAACHRAGANSTIVPPAAASGTAGCFNNTLCHFHELPYAPPTVAASVHGAVAKQDLRVCQSCHGASGSTSFDGQARADGLATTACSSCHAFAKAHPTDWQGSGSFSHRSGLNIPSACTLCHDVTLGRSAPLPAAPSCFRTSFTNGAGQTRTCHANGPGVAPHAVPYNNHNATARSNFSYCLGCHQIAADLGTASGKVIPRCLTCHLGDPTATPTGCTSCHARPPGGASYPNLAGVHGGHRSLNVPENATLTAGCDQCHSGLGLGSVDHLNRARARTASLQAGAVVFGPLAQVGGLTPTYTFATQLCTNTYCHGNSLDRPASAILSPVWSAPFLTGNAASDCVKCHGYPPATATHAGKTPSECSGCHSHVNASGTGFSDPSRHINGFVEASAAHAFPHPGAAHRGAAGGTGCRSSSCHPADLAGSSYPVAAGTPPNCRACHLNASPSTTPRCSDCHGSAGNDAAGALLAGRPRGGTAFPNRPGQHNRSEHVGRACTVCHPFGSGNAAHGWSNRQRSSAARVGGAGTSITSWNPAGNSGRGSCSPTCHGSEAWY